MNRLQIESFTEAVGSFTDNAECSVHENEPLSAHTSFHIGGAARMYVCPKSVEALISAVSAAQSLDIPYFVIGQATNVLFDDSGYDGAVICTSGIDNIDIDGTTVTAGCGAKITRVSSDAARAGLNGLAFAYGIPGSVGGAVYMNAGAYGGQIADVLTESTYLDVSTGKIGKVCASEHKFGYRESVYRENPTWLVLSAEFALTQGDTDKIRADMDDIMNRRREKQPLEYPSAGSTFKRYPGRYTGQMIEEAGLKGYTVGGAQVSEKHAGFVINKGGATCADVRELIRIIKEKIHEKFGVDIECEVIYVENPGR